MKDTDFCDRSRRRRSHHNKPIKPTLSLAAEAPVDSDPDSPGNYFTSWFWQICNEFGYIFTSDPTLHMLGYNTINPDYIVTNCKEKFPDSKYES